MFKPLMIALMGISLSSPVTADLVEGEDYTELDEAVETSVDDDQIEVTEAFWYGCPHCYNLEEPLNEWVAEQPDDVVFTRTPATMGGDWNQHAAAFYAARELGILDDLHDDFFTAIHEEGRSLTSEDDLADFFSDYGVSEEDARNALNSFDVKSQVNRAHARMRAYELTGVPALVIDGRYVITPSSAGGLDAMPEIAGELVDKVREERSE
ncbi:thiol:disulfide interchange protein DsbA/DsbL [Aidingimonas halophila]|uniref:Thiol:disulfide interchange protein n=1 Tax=Aidingimonas halophila TaxID=574349 RepID=A0A1H2Y5F8_9GAMM|nr:thiol:disulfide interchange protein DsbA/DsbL [Aidingimonas halophila]GHC34476.1 thiol:disulfide interchange protein DsbA [Aidingimonas halophila]SDX00215.1 Thiol:disulfide interchange protein DsbA [Aidingimonas halophila]